MAGTVARSSQRLWVVTLLAGQQPERLLVEVVDDAAIGMIVEPGGDVRHVSPWDPNCPDQLPIGFEEVPSRHAHEKAGEARVREDHALAHMTWRASVRRGQLAMQG